MPIDRLTPERRRQLTREALIAAAADVFTQKGFHAASLDEIAEAAGFTRGAIYSNFGSKEELLFAVIDHSDDIGLAGVADAMDAAASDDPAGVTEETADAWARIIHRSPDLIALSLELRLYALRNPAARQRLADFERQTVDKLSGFIEDEFDRRGVALAVPAEVVAELGRAAVDGLEQIAAVDEQRAEHYRELVSTLFLLLARAAVQPATGPGRAQPARGRGPKRPR